VSVFSGRRLLLLLLLLLGRERGDEEDQRRLMGRFKVRADCTARRTLRRSGQSAT